MTRRGRVPPEDRGKANLTLADWPDIMTLAQAAAKIGMSAPYVRQAVRNGELNAFIPRGKDPMHTGPRMGYRVTREELERWYFNKPRPETGP